MEKKKNTNIFLILATAMLLLSIQLTAQNTNADSTQATTIDIKQLNGKWTSSCQERFDAPGELECIEFIDHRQIKVDIKTGEGIEKSINYQMGSGTKFLIAKENGKWLIDYFLPPNNEALRGEIVVLNEKEFKVKFEEQKFYTIQEKVKE